MSYPRRTLRLAAAIGAAALTLTTNAAHASPPSTVSVAGSTAGATHNSLATATGSISMTWDADPSGTVAMSCTSITEGGTITDGRTSWYPSTTFATVDHTLAAWSGCTGLGLNFAVTQLSDWHVGITGDTVAGVTPETIPDIHAEIKDVDFGGGLCDFDVDGSVTGTFDNSTQDLSITGSSLIDTIDPHSTGADCAGQFKDGGSFYLTGTFHITDRSGVVLPVTISN